MWRAFSGGAWQKGCGAIDMQQRAYLRAEIDAVVADLYAVSEYGIWQGFVPGTAIWTAKALNTCSIQ